MQTAYTNRHDNWTTEKEVHAHNSGFAACGVKCLYSSAVFQFNFSAGLTVLCPEIPHERKAAKRYAGLFAELREALDKRSQ